MSGYHTTACWELREAATSCLTEAASLHHLCMPCLEARQRNESHAIQGMAEFLSNEPTGPELVEYFDTLSAEDREAVYVVLTIGQWVTLGVPSPAPWTF